MYLLKGKKINIDAPYTDENGRGIANFRDPGERARYDVVEVPDPIYPDPDLFDWTENLDGSLNITPKPKELIAERAMWKAKLQRIDAVSKLIVTTQAGHTYDADKDSQIMMGVYLSALEDGDIIPWVLADNSVVMIDRVELKAALRLAGAALAPLWVKPYEVTP